MNNQPEDDMKSNDINNLNDEQNNSSNTKNNPDTSAIYFGDSSLQTKAEFDQNKKTDHTKEDNAYTSSGVEDTESDSESAAGTDRAGTAERKIFGDPELNKGLEAQAKDEESS